MWRRDRAGRATRLVALCAALAAAAGQGQAQGTAARRPAAAAPAGSAPASTLRADEIRGRPDLEAVAEGRVEFRRGELLLEADRVTYEQVEDLARARGQVRISTAAGHFSGPELQLQLGRFEGWFLEPQFELRRLQAGGRAARVDFIDSARSLAHDARYTSCPRQSGDAPAWVLEARRVRLDTDANEGQAEGAVLRFLGVPILALPAMSFPLSEERKSGWLPPHVNLDSRSGLELGVPYYWNIAAQRDATFVPRVLSKRGFALDSEFRWLEPRHRGEVRLDWLPADQVAGRSRHALSVLSQGEPAGGLRWRVDGLRASDDAWWKDFPGATRSLAPRLLSTRLEVERDLSWAGGAGLAYARVQSWQVLQGSDLEVRTPYERRPQVGLQWRRSLPGGLDLALESEFNRFERVEAGSDPMAPTGLRWHALGSLTRPWQAPGLWVTPKLSFNAASYDLDQAMADGRRRASRLVPTLSVDARMEFERETRWFGSAVRQTLEPRLLYVNTPWRAQALLPLFDSAGKDFNVNSIFSENPFSGIDRVADAHQLTAGLTSRWLDPANGAEALRLGVVQRYLFRPQRLTPEGVPFTQRFSDLYLLGAGQLGAGLGMDAVLQYSPDLGRPVRSIFSARWTPGPFRTLSSTYRYSRGSSEQLELGWQWPLWKADAGAARGTRAGACNGDLYSVGRLNYSLQDSRITDSVLGLEYDSGCWIARVVAERLSTGRSEATTRLMLQLELVGLSRLGSNPLQVLKDNIPGYRLLREERR